MPPSAMAEGSSANLVEKTADTMIGFMYAAAEYDARCRGCESDSR